MPNEAAPRYEDTSGTVVFIPLSQQNTQSHPRVQSVADNILGSAASTHSLSLPSGHGVVAPTHNLQTREQRHITASRSSPAPLPAEESHSTQEELLTSATLISPNSSINQLSVDSPNAADPMTASMSA